LDFKYQFLVNSSFISISGWSSNMDLMDDDLFEVQLKKEMVEAAEQVIAVADSSKFSKQGVTSFAPISRVKMIITDDAVSIAQLSKYRQAGVTINICGSNNTRLFELNESRSRFRLGFANLDDSIPFAALVRQGLTQAAIDQNIELITTDNKLEGPTALANVEYFVEQKVDLVVDFNLDARYGNVIMERLRAVQIPAIAVEIPLPGATFMGVDNYKAGLMGGSLTGHFVQLTWDGKVDNILSLDLPVAGQVPAARMQGQLDGLRELVAFSDDDVIVMDSQNTFEGANSAVEKLIPALRVCNHIVIFGINDGATLGALAAFEEAGVSDRVVAVSQGADQAVRQEMMKPGSRLIGAVAYFPENYGNIIITLAAHILQDKRTPPAVYTDHMLVLPDKVMNTLNLSNLDYENISVQNYEATSLRIIENWKRTEL
jgi:ribose transport system substrate-binding protein